MKNVNRDYLVTVDAKTAKITPPRDMKFFITDILTCNIFFQLVFNDSGNLINAYAPNEDASNYTLTLRILKPDNTTKEVSVTLLNEGSNFFIADLEPSCTDYLGVYQCELFIDTEINGRAERSTTDSFTYEVIKSVFTAVDEIIEGDPNYPGILDSFATRDYVTNAIKNMDLYGFATRDYVNQVIVGGEFDLSEYITDEELRDALANADLDNYVTEAELAQALVDITTGGTVDLSAYVTDKELEDALAGFSTGDSYNDTEIRNLIANKADSEHTHDEYITDTELTDKNYVTNTELTNRNYATNNSVDERIAESKLNKITRVYPVNNVITLTADKYQRATISSDVEIILPTGYLNDESFSSDDYFEIHLFLSPSQNVEIQVQTVKHQASPPILGGNIYEYIFTYIGTEWLAGVIAYV